MAKDGTRRGGRRVRAGDKPKALSDKIAEGKDADIMEFHAPELDAADLDNAADLTGADMPSPSAYLSAQQKRRSPQYLWTAGKTPDHRRCYCLPVVQMSQTFQKQANLLWYEIFDIVKQNCTTKFDGTPQDDLMEQLLSSRK